MRFVGSTVFVAPPCGPGTNLEEFEAVQLVEKNVTRAVKLAREQAQQCDSHRWSDPDFGPTAQDPTGISSIYETGNPPGPGYPTPNEIVWTRPAIRSSQSATTPRGSDHWCTNGELFKRPLSQNGIVQGRLGDGWFLGALVVIAHGNENGNNNGDEAIRNLFWHGGRFKEYGIYICRFYFQSRWHYVLVDDQLPTFKSQQGARCFARSGDESEMWVSILEKAYAKLHGSYRSLVGGRTEHALRDCTGLACQTIGIQRTSSSWSRQYRDEVISGQLHNRLQDKLKQGSVIGSVMLPEPLEEQSNLRVRKGSLGLVKRQTYPIIGAGIVNGAQLVWLDNPWGVGSWIGTWGTGSNEFLSNQSSLRDVFGDEVLDRGFLMSFEDWSTQFHEIVIAGSPEPSDKGQLVSWLVKGQWEIGKSGGNASKATWYQNPVVRMRLYEPVTQINLQLFRNLPKEFNTIGSNSHNLMNQTHLLKTQDMNISQPVSFTLTTLDRDGYPIPVKSSKRTNTLLFESTTPKEESVPNRFDSNGQIPEAITTTEQPEYVYWSTISLDVSLPPGDYAIVPSCYERDAIGEYTIRLSTDAKTSIDQGYQTLSHSQLCARLRSQRNLKQQKQLAREKQPWNAPVDQILESFDGRQESHISLCNDNSIQWGSINPSSLPPSVVELQNNVDHTHQIEDARERMMNAFVSKGVTIDQITQCFCLDHKDTELGLLEFKQGLLRLGFDISDLPEFQLDCIAQTPNDKPTTEDLLVHFLKHQHGLLLKRNYVPPKLEDDFYFRPVSEVTGTIQLEILEGDGIDLSARNIVQQSSSQSLLFPFSNSMVLNSSNDFEQVDAKIGRVERKTVVVRFWRPVTSSTLVLLSANNPVGITLYDPAERVEYGAGERGVQYITATMFLQAMESNENWTQLCDQTLIGMSLIRDDTTTPDTEFTISSRHKYLSSLFETIRRQQHDNKKRQIGSRINNNRSAEYDSWMIEPVEENVLDVVSVESEILQLSESSKDEIVLKQGERERQLAFMKYKQSGNISFGIAEGCSRSELTDFNSVLGHFVEYEHDNSSEQNERSEVTQASKLVQSVMEITIFEKLDVMLSSLIDRQECNTKSAIDMKPSGHQLLYSRVAIVPGEAKVHRRQLEKSGNLRSWFSSLDMDGNNKVEAIEFQGALDDFGIRLTQQELDSVIQRFDSDHNGNIDYHEFARVMQDRGTDSNDRVESVEMLLKSLQDVALATTPSQQFKFRKGNPTSLKSFAKQIRKYLGFHASNEARFGSHTVQGRNTLKRLIWVIGSCRTLNQFIASASEISFDLSKGYEVIQKVIANVGCTVLVTNSPQYQDDQYSGERIQDAIHRVLSEHGELVSGSYRMNANTFANFVIQQWAQGIAATEESEGTPTALSEQVQQLNEEFVSGSDQASGELITPTKLLPVGVQIRMVLEKSGAFGTDSTLFPVNHGVLTQVVLDKTITQVCNKLRHMFLQQQRTRIGNVWHLVDVFALPSHGGNNKPVGLHIQVTNPDTGNVFKLNVDSVFDRDWFNQVCPPNGGVCFSVGNDENLPLCQLERRIEAVVDRLRFVKPSLGASHPHGAAAAAQSLVLVEPEEQVNEFQKILESASLPFFATVSNRTVKFVVETQTRHVSQETNIEQLKQLVFCAIRKRQNILNHILNNVSSACQWKVVLKNLNGYGNYKMKWSEFVLVLRQQVNPFVVASLRPGMQQVCSKPVQDGGSNLNFKTMAQFEYVPTKHSIHTRRLEQSLVCRLGGKYMVVQIYEIDDPTGTGSRTKVIAYDPSSQCEFEVQRNPSSIEAKRRSQPDLISQQNSIELFPGETWEDVVHDLELGEPISPRLVVQVLNDHPHQIQTVGSGEIPISIAVENPGVSNGFWVSLCNEDGNHAGNVRVKIQFQPNSRTSLQLRALEADSERSIARFQRRALQQTKGDESSPFEDDVYETKYDSDLDLVLDDVQDEYEFESAQPQSKDRSSTIPNTRDLIGDVTRKVRSVEERGLEASRMRSDVNSIAEKLKESEQLRASLEMTCRKHELELRRAQHEIELQQQQVVDLTRTKAKEQDNSYPHSGLKGGKRRTNPTNKSLSRHSQVATQEARRRDEEELKQLRSLQEENNKLRVEMEKRETLVKQQVSLLRKQIAQKEIDLRNEHSDKQRRLQVAESQLVQAQTEASLALKRAQVSSTLNGGRQTNNARAARHLRQERLARRRKREEQLKNSMGEQYATYIRDLQQILNVVKKQVSRRRPESPQKALQSLERFLSINMDDNGKVQRVDFEESLLDFGVKITAQEIDMVSTHFDTNGDNLVDVAEFLDGLRGQVGDAELAVGSGAAAVRANGHGAQHRRRGY